MLLDHMIEVLVKEYSSKQYAYIVTISLIWLSAFTHSLVILYIFSRLINTHLTCLYQHHADNGSNCSRITLLHILYRHYRRGPIAGIVYVMLVTLLHLVHLIVAWLRPSHVSYIIPLIM